MVVLNGMSRYYLAAEARRENLWFASGGSRPDLDLRVRGGDRKGHRLLEGALRGSARGTRLDLDAMNSPAEISTMGPKARVPDGTLTRLALPVGHTEWST